MKIAGAETLFSVMTKSAEVFPTMPVGDPVPPFAAGIATVRGIFWPPPVYKVDWLVTLSLTQKGLVGRATNPQAFTRFGSAAVPPAPLSVTRSVRLYCAAAQLASASNSPAA